MNKNIKLFSYYIGLTYDFLFFGTVQVLFFLIIKDISASNILILESFFALIRLVIQIPLTKITKKYGNLFALRIGPIFTVLSLITFIVSPNLFVIIIGYIFKAIGWGFQTISYPPLIYNELKNEHMEKDYNKIQGEGQSIFSLVNIFSAFLAGALFDINGYIPIFICLIIHLSVVVISFLIDIPNVRKAESTKVIVNYKKVINIKFFVHLFLYAAITWGLLGAYMRMNTAYFETLNVSATNIGIIFGAVGIIGFLSSKYQYKLELFLKNKSVNIFSILLTIPFLLMGILFLIHSPLIILLIIGIMVVAGDQIVRSTFRIYMLEYLNKYSVNDLREETLSLYYIFEPLGRIVITFIAGLILKTNNIGLSYIVLISIFAIPLFIVTQFLYKDLKKEHI